MTSLSRAPVGPWNVCADAGPLTLCALHLQRAAEAHRPLPHRAQSEVAWKRLFRSKADSVVNDFQHDLIGAAGEPQIDAAGLGLLGEVGEGILRNAVDGLLGFGGEIGVGAPLRRGPQAA